MKIWLRIHLGVLLIAPAFLIGGVHSLTQLLAAGAAVAFLFLVVGRRAWASTEKTRWVFPPWAWVFLAAIAVTGFQLLPLPSGLISLLSPEADAAFRTLLTPLGLYNSDHWQALSLAPADTTLKWLRDLGALALLLSVFHWVRSREHLRKLLRLSVIGAIGLVSLTLLQTILNMPNPLMGLYKPSQLVSQLLKGSPFVNQNHLGAYLAFHAILCMSLAENAEPGKERWSWIGGLALLCVGIIGSLSRGAIVAFVLGAAGFLYCLGRKMYGHMDQEELAHDPEEYKRYKERKKRSSREPRVPWPGWKALWRNPTTRGLATLFLIVFGVLLHWGSAEIYENFRVNRESLKREKHVAIYQVASPLIQHYAMVGVGRGATGIAWTRYTTNKTLKGGQITPTHIESQVLQPLVDWGVLFGSMFVLAALWLLWVMWRRTEGLLEQSCWIALAVIVLQNAVDFNLEFVGTTFPFLAVLAGLDSLQHKRRKRGTVRRWPAWLALGIGAFATVALAMAGPFAQQHNMRQVRARWMEVQAAPTKQFPKRLKRLFAKHPADFTLALRTARHYLRRKRPKFKTALQWLERAKYLNPTSAALYFLYAQTYAELGLKEQAVMALERSARLDPSYTRRIHIMAQHYKLTVLMLRKTTFLNQVHATLPSWLQSAPKPSVKWRILNRLLTYFKDDFLTHYLVVNERLKQYRTAYNKAKDAASTKQTRAQLFATLQQCQRKFPRCDGVSHLYKGHIMAIEGRRRLALKMYRSAKQTKYTRWTATTAELGALYHLKAYKRALKEIARAKTRFYRPLLLAQLYHWEGKIYRATNDLQKAKSAYEEAVTLSDNTTYWLGLAWVCWERGETKRAMRIVRRLAKKPKHGHIKALQKRWEQSLAKKQQMITPHSLPRHRANQPY